MKSNAFKYCVALFTVCSVLLLPDCNDKSDTTVKPKISFILRSRTIATAPGRISFTDEVDMLIKDSDEPRILNFPGIKSDASWAAIAVIIPWFSGEMTMRPVITNSKSGLTFDYGAFKVVDAVSFTCSMSISDTPFYGFIQGIPIDDASFSTNIVVENGKNYVVPTVTQKFILLHTNGCDSDEQTIVFKCKNEISGTSANVTEVSRTTTINRSQIIPWVHDFVNLFQINFSSIKGTSIESYFSLSTNAKVSSYSTSSYIVKSLDITADDFEIEDSYGDWIPDFTESPGYVGPIKRTAKTTLKLGSGAENNVIAFNWEDIAFRVPDGKIIDLSEPTCLWTPTITLGKVNSVGNERSVSFGFTFHYGDANTVSLFLSTVKLILDE